MWDKKWLSITNSVIALFTLMLYLSMHTMICYIGFATFHAMPYIIMGLLVVLAVLSLLDTLYKHKKVMTIVLTIINLCTFVVGIAYFIGFIRQIKIFLRAMPVLLGIYIIIFLIVYLIFYFPKVKHYNKLVAIILCVVLSLVTIIGCSDIKNIVINHFTEGAVVYVVEDDYQIVFTTAAKGTGYVVIGDQTYYDEKAGSLVDSQTVHKITVPQNVLDEKKSYTIGSKTIFFEEAFSAIRGRTITKDFTFRPIDETDGLQYYTVADAHDSYSGVVSAADYYGSKTDFIIVGGDSVDFLGDKTSLERVLHLNYEVSKGQIPVVFARGNHELKGRQASNLYRYVGTNDNDEYYYTFTLGQTVWGIVLDMGESYDDDWYEFYGTAMFESYRNKQLGFVQGIIDNKDSEYDADGIEHRIAISHIATAITSYEKLYFYDYFIDLNLKLNQIPLDVMLNGHIHEAFYVPDNYLVGDKLDYVNTSYIGGEANDTIEFIATGANYNSLFCSRHSDIQSISKNENMLGGGYLGVALEYKLDEGVLEVRFTNSNKEIIKSENPFKVDESYGKVIYLS